jgi:hypothetical protein
MDPETQNDDIAAVTALDLLLGHATEQVVPNMATKGDPYERAILVALFARSVPLTEAISQLGKDGFGREALMLNRPLFELMLDAYWTHANLKLATSVRKAGPDSAPAHLSSRSRSSSMTPETAAPT